jgi:hypothetical protein
MQLDESNNALCNRQLRWKRETGLCDALLTHDELPFSMDLRNLLLTASIAPSGLFGLSTAGWKRGGRL